LKTLKPFFVFLGREGVGATGQLEDVTTGLGGRWKKGGRPHKEDQDGWNGYVLGLFLSIYLSICVNLSTFLSSSVHILHHSIPPPPSLPLSLFICHSLVKHLFGLTRRYLFRNVHYTTDQDSSLCPCSMQHYKVLLSILSLNILEHSLRNVFFQSIEKTFDIW